MAIGRVGLRFEVSGCQHFALIHLFLHTQN